MRISGAAGGSFPKRLQGVSGLPEVIPVQHERAQMCTGLAAARRAFWFTLEQGT